MALAGTWPFLWHGSLLAGGKPPGPPSTHLQSEFLYTCLIPIFMHIFNSNLYMFVYIATSTHIICHFITVRRFCKNGKLSSNFCVCQVHSLLGGSSQPLLAYYKELDYFCNMGHSMLGAGPLIPALVHMLHLNHPIFQILFCKFKWVVNSY